ncbi:endonuclease/reverse transcriptase [Trypanosoma conorhini]|uniref:Endonuclease/reverse transcriptase n=1 Tax=Trypanosoma conorhini TaxID=83891 RepID=A0A3R7KTA8_9TRYP|nr:endonuclease/reverse transcriptase [Trypanosoma conorhini]RNF00933.1 endonuclease/reverse transcriptase [Trypanosoma conorhini]
MPCRVLRRDSSRHWARTAFRRSRHGKVRLALRRLRPQSAPDNDGISPRLLQRTSEVLAPRLAKAYTAILRDPASTPVSWKRCTFIPLLKPGKAPELATSYRPVCITSLLSRVCERVVLDRVLMATHGQLDGAQYGFTPSRTTMDALMRILAPVRHGLDTSATRRNVTTSGPPSASRRVRQGSILGLLVFSDAFCKASHGHIMDRLRALGVPTYLQRFILAWLTDRRGRTFFSGTLLGPGAAAVWRAPRLRTGTVAVCGLSRWPPVQLSSTAHLEGNNCRSGPAPSGDVSHYHGGYCGLRG